MIVEIVLNLPLRQTFDYLWPEDWLEPPVLGERVFVPFGSQKKSGVIVQLKEHSEHPKLRRVESRLEDSPIFSPALLQFTRWAADYYFCGWGEVLNAALPGGLAVKLQTHVQRLVPAEALQGFETLRPSLAQFLREHSSWILAEWHKQNPTPAEERLARLWLKHRQIHQQQSLIGSKMTAKTERWLRLKHQDFPPPQTGRKQRKREAILQLLLEREECSLVALKDHVAAPAEALKLLVAEGIVEIIEKRLYRRFLKGNLPPRSDFQALTPEQQQAFTIIHESLEHRTYQTFLLYGVTGSGKTEVYLHLVRATLAQGRTCLILVPEISLTPQLVDRFRARFGDEIAILHSGMDDGERFDEWSKVQQGEVPIVIGARSAVFAPLENLGLIIVDEEHDPSYKQDETPRYHGRDLAIVRGLRAKATVVLGSATPSLESYYNVQQGKYRELQMLSRVHQQPLPEVYLLDMEKTPRQAGSFFFSVQLVEALRHRLLQKEQSILFLNRRGYASLMRCADCEAVIQCENCSLSLVYHQSVEILCCHQCDYTLAVPHTCPTCASQDLRKLGVGTEQIEAELKVMFPEARLLRMDRDTLHGKHSLGEMLERIHRHEVDIVVGTQLVTKGHDFPNITLVGVILADLSLNFPDFRVAERTFQLLTQVAGRAGRGEKPGQVFIQTYKPDHHSLVCAQAHDTAQFRERELLIRKNLNWMPYTSIVQIVVSSPQEQRAEELARQLAQRFASSSACRVLGPKVAPIKKLKNRFRWNLLLQASHVKHLHQALTQALQSSPVLVLRDEERLTIDIDPYNLL